MKIIRLESANVKKLVAVEVTPTGNVVIIGGKNGAGKSSLLDSIEYALGGDPSAKLPVRRGEEKARIVVDLGDIVVRRTFTAAGGTSLVVTDADNKKLTTPQSILDKLVGKLSFDPLEFARLSAKRPKEAADILRGIVGINFEAKEAEREKVFAERTEVNRDVKSLEAQIAAMPKHEGLPAEEVSASAILDEQAAAAKVNAANKALRNKVAELTSNMAKANEAIEDAEELCAEAQKEIDRWKAVLETRENALAVAKRELPGLEQAVKDAQAAAESAQDVDLSGFAQRAAAVEQTNRKVREAKRRAELVKQLKAKASEVEKLTDRLDSIDSEKRKAAMEAKYPIEGLAFDVAGGVTFNSIPFDQCSGAEQLKVSIAVGIALNPKLRVLLCRDASLLDEDSLAVVAEMAKAHDMQIWLEQVGSDGNTSVVIEDGHVKLPGELADLGDDVAAGTITEKEAVAMGNKGPEERMVTHSDPPIPMDTHGEPPAAKPKKPKKVAPTEKEGSLL